MFGAKALSSAGPCIQYERRIATVLSLVCLSSAVSAVRQRGLVAETAARAAASRALMAAVRYRCSVVMFKLLTVKYNLT